MALFKNQHLGKVKGRLGDTIFKERNGTSYVAAPPVIFHKSNAPNCVRARNVFGMTNKLFAALGGVYIVKNLWKSSPISKGTFINKMQKVNKGLVGKDYDLTKIKMAPFDILFSMEIESYELIPKGLKIVIAPPAVKRDMIAGAKCSVQGALHCIFQETKKDGTVQDVDYFFTAQSDDQIYTESGSMEFNLNVIEAHMTAFLKSDNKRFYAFMLVKDQTGFPHRASETVGGTL